MKKINIQCYDNGRATLRTKDIHIESENIASIIEVDFSQVEYKNYQKGIDIQSGSYLLRYFLGNDEVVFKELTYENTLPGELVITPFVFDEVSGRKVRYLTDYSVIIHKRRSIASHDFPDNVDLILEEVKNFLEGTTGKLVVDMEFNNDTNLLSLILENGDEISTIIDSGVDLSNYFNKTEINSMLDDKADLVDGKVPLEQLPDMEITKQKVEDVLTGDITSHNHATEIGNHNTSETAHNDIRQKVDEAKAIAEGKSRARVFATKSELDAWLLVPENVALLQIGDNFYIEETDTPDYWWNGATIKELETQKVDLTEYAKKSEIPTIPDITVNNGDAESGKYISQVAVDETDKHKLVITKADLPQGFATEEAVQAKINTHNTSETAHSDIRQAIEEVRELAEEPPVLVQSDWLESDSESPSFIKNKPMDIILEVSGTDSLEEYEKENIHATIMSIMKPDLSDIDNTKFDDIIMYADQGYSKYHYTDICVEPSVGLTIGFMRVVDSSNIQRLDIVVTFSIPNAVSIKKTQLRDVRNFNSLDDLPALPDDADTVARYLFSQDHDMTLFVIKPLGLIYDYYSVTNRYRCLTYTRAQIDGLVRNSTGKTKELKSITTEPTGTFVEGDLYYNSSTKELYYYRGSVWELTGVGTPMEGVIYSFNGNLYFWNEAEADLIQIGGEVDLSDYYTTTEIDTKLAGKANATHNHTISEITDFPTIPTIPDITVNNGNAESGKYISQVVVDATDKHKLIVTKADLPQSTVDLNEMAYFNYAGSIYGAKYNLLENAWQDMKDSETVLFDIPLELVAPNQEMGGFFVDLYVGTNGQLQALYDACVNETIPQTNTYYVNNVATFYEGDVSSVIGFPIPLYSFGFFSVNDNVSFVIGDLTPLSMGLGLVLAKIAGVSIPNNNIVIQQGFDYDYENENGVIIPNSVTSIGQFAFYNWSSNNQPLVIPNSVTYIGDYSFQDWSSNNQPLVIPNSVTSIGQFAFYNWSSNNQPLVIPDSVTSIGEHAFYNWSANNQPLVIPDSVTSIGEYAFYAWSSNNHPLVIPNSVTSIGNSAFSYWTSNNQPLVIPNSVTSIGLEAFYAWSSNNHPLVIPNSVTSIGNSAFQNWSLNYHPLVIPDSVTSIGNFSFANWSNTPHAEIHATTPPILGTNNFNGSYPIYVPDASLNAYKTATNWSALSSRIFPISEYYKKSETYSKTEIDNMIGDIETLLGGI